MRGLRFEVQNWETKVPANVRRGIDVKGAFNQALNIGATFFYRENRFRFG